MSERRPNRARHAEGTFSCARCSTVAHASALVRVSALRHDVTDALALSAATPDSFVCRSCTAHARALVFREQLLKERGELSALETEIARRAAEHISVARDLDAAREKDAGLGDRMADGIARVGGSWAFVLGFLLCLVIWMLFNAMVLGAGAFDPFPFILLNLVLSCVAAIQAPIILMSQNRSAARDRAQATQDYTVNLKAELEVAALHDKVDLLLHQKWETLATLQETQMELLEELLSRAAPSSRE